MRLGCLFCTIAKVPYNGGQPIRPIEYHPNGELPKKCA